jgi:hypothetical protein
MPGKPMIDLIVIKALQLAHDKGDLDRMEKLFNRTIGKVPDTIIHGGAVVGLNAEIESDPQSLAEAAKAYREALKG